MRGFETAKIQKNYIFKDNIIKKYANVRECAYVKFSSWGNKNCECALVLHKLKTPYYEKEIVFYGGSIEPGIFVVREICGNHRIEHV